MVGFGLLGTLMRTFNWPAAPVLLGFVLGPMMEEHFRRAMQASRGDLMIFVERPISATVIAITFVLLFWGLAMAFRQHRATRRVIA